MDRGERQDPGEMLRDAAVHIAAIAAALDPFTTSQLGIGVTSAHGTGTDGPRRVVMTGNAQRLAPSNQARRGLVIYNESADVMYVGFGSAASLTTTRYTLQLVAGAYYEMPGAPFYTGEVSILGTATDAALVTEMS